MIIQLGSSYNSHSGKASNQPHQNNVLHTGKCEKAAFQPAVRQNIGLFLLYDI